MNIDELGKRLINEGIPNSMFNISGRGLDDEKYCLENESGKWLVYLCERGIRFDLRIYDVEGDACEDLYKRVKKSFTFDMHYRKQIQSKFENQK